MFIPETALIQRVLDCPGYFKLYLGLRYTTKAGIHIDIPAGFETDLASIPRPLRLFLRVNGKHQDAAILHDYLYAEQGFVGNKRYCRAACDELFFQAMIESDVPEWKAFVMWAGVRIGGWLAWR